MLEVNINVWSLSNLVKFPYSLFTAVIDKLAASLNLDLNSYGLELLKAGADLSDLTADELVQIDSKEFDCNRT